MKPFYLLILLTLLLNSCLINKQLKIESKFVKSSATKSKLNPNEWKSWQHKDIQLDSIAGISLDRAYSFLESKKHDTTIVAILDTRIIKGNKDINGFIWINRDEIPNNNIDDDRNGYIDDIHGWNFLGNSNGEQEYVANYEFVRIIRKFEPIFGKKYRNQVKDTVNFDIYKNALNTLEEELAIINQNIAYLDSVNNLRNSIEKRVQDNYPKIELNSKNLDSLKKIAKDSSLLEKIDFLKSYIKDESWYRNRYLREKKHLEVYFNTNYNERFIINDDPNNILDKNYGNPNIFSDTLVPKHTHSIKVVGALTANRNNDYGIRGVTNHSKIMMLAVSPSGDEHDKDISLGIRYAVDNGAKIINITFTKYYSLHSEWVKEALKYAEANDVLIVCSAGNYNKNIDLESYYPNDIDDNRKEVLNNLLMVGSSTPFNSKYLVSDYSNYGKTEVDIFAPGEYIYTTTNVDKFDYASGTSYSAPIVSGVAALIRSYYPNLSAAEVKQIIMESGVSFDLMVNKPSLGEEKELVPFSSLSKSGKIVNAYNALLMAEEVSKKKKNR